MSSSDLQFTWEQLGECRDIWGSLELGDTSNIPHIAVSIRASNEPSRSFTGGFKTLTKSPIPCDLCVDVQISCLLLTWVNAISVIVKLRLALVSSSSEVDTWISITCSYLQDSRLSALYKIETYHSRGRELSLKYEGWSSDRSEGAEIHRDTVRRSNAGISWPDHVYPIWSMNFD